METTGERHYVVIARRERRARVVWASGAGGTYLVTIDGGEHWRAGAVPGAENRDFRAVHAVDDHTALLVSAGEGPQSAVYKTTDAGQHWRQVWTNPYAKGFFDAIAFWDARRGVVLSDPVEGIFRLFTTSSIPPTPARTGRP